MRAAVHVRAGALALLATATPITAQPLAPPAKNTCLANVPEAASRSGLSPDIVLRVMMAESGGSVRIVSAKGAMGCMQIMPATWSYLSPRYNLGDDPFDARRNMIGGAMYLAELTTRYGMPGALAAFNAGPCRYERYVAGTVALPAETNAYVARIGMQPAARALPVTPPRWQEAGLFLAPAAKSEPVESSGSAARGADRQPSVGLFPLSN